MNSKGDYDDESRVRIFTHLFDLIAYLHTNGIVHHDVRPGNFFIIEDGSPVMIDLGLAHWHKLPDTLFDSGIGPQGDFRYMAPEQIKGTRGDSRSDLYSLGMMLFNVYTGSFPYTGGSRTLNSKQEWLKMKGTVAQNIAGHELLSTGLGRIILKATAWDIRERYQWVEDMRNDFNEDA
jgi:serine/threonine-protein kinase